MLYDDEVINSEDDKFSADGYTNKTAKKIPFTTLFNYKQLDESIGNSKILNKDVISDSGRHNRTNKTF